MCAINFFFGHWNVEAFSLWKLLFQQCLDGNLLIYIILHLLCYLLLKFQRVVCAYHCFFKNILCKGAAGDLPRLLGVATETILFKYQRQGFEKKGFNFSNSENFALTSGSRNCTICSNRAGNVGALVCCAALSPEPFLLESPVAKAIPPQFVWW